MWNHDLSVLRKAANKAFHKAYKSKLEQDWQAHHAARTAFKKELRRSKRESWQDFRAKTEGASYTSRVYKLLDKSNTAPLGMLKLPSGQWTTTLEEAYKHLLETHFSAHTLYHQELLPDQTIIPLNIRICRN